MKKSFIIYLLVFFFFSVKAAIAQEVYVENNKVFVENIAAEKVEDLNLSDFSLVQLPSNLADFSNLKSLNISNNGLSNVQGISVLSKLEKLNLDNNPNLVASSLNDELPLLSDLKELSIQNSNLPYIPYDVFNLSSLERLDLSNNNIELISFEIKKLKRLNFLDISNNTITYIDNGIIGLRALQHLKVQNNPIQNIPHLFLQLAGLNRLEHLSIDYQATETVTAAVLPINSVKELHLYEVSAFYENELDTYFPFLNSFGIYGDATEEDINSLLVDFYDENIDTLLIFCENTANLPTKIYSYNTLNCLSIVSEEIIMLPNEIARFSKLKEIRLIGNSVSISSLVQQLSRVPLSTLQIQSNTAISLPAELSKLQTLGELNLQASEILNVSKELVSLMDLKMVRLSSKTERIENLDFVRRQMPNCHFFVNSNDVTITKNGMNPPLVSVNVAFDEVVVAADKAQKLAFTTGTTLDIPEDAFLDKNGNVVKGNVRVAYREFNDPIDMALAGIPMTEEEGGETYMYASAGMMEFRAFQQKEELFANPNRPITVNYNSPFSGSDYDLYYLDPEEEKWKNIGKDSIQSLENVEQLGGAADMDSLSAMPSAPFYMNYPYRQQRVQLIGFQFYDDTFFNRLLNRRDRLNISVSVNSRPRRIKRDTVNKLYSDLKDLSRLKWELDFSNKSGMTKKEFKALEEKIDLFRQASSGVRNNLATIPFTWNSSVLIDDFWLEPDVNRDNFNFVLSMNGELVRIPVKPKNIPSNVRVAQRKMNSYYKRYKKSLAARKSDWALIDKKNEKKVEEYAEVMANYEEKWQAYNTAIQKYSAIELKELKTYAATEGGVIRSFQLSGFGTFNCDIRNRMSSPKPLLAQLKSTEGKLLDVKRIYILDKGNNGLLTFNGQENAFFDGGKENCLIAILPNEKIAVLKSEDFKASNLNLSDSQALLSVYDMKTTTINQLRKDANFF